MKKIYIAVLFLLGPCLAFSQNSNAAYFMDKVNSASTGSRIEVNAEGDTILVSEYHTRNVKLNSSQSFERYYMGTPYLNNGWFKGKVVLPGSEPVEGLMAYDLVRSSVYYSKNANSNAVELKPTEFIINGHSFSNYKEEFQGAGDYYYETLVHTQPMLLKQYDCNYSVSKSDVDNGYGSAKANLYEGVYEKKEKFYVVVGNKLILVTKRKSFLKSLENFSKAAMHKVTSEKLNMKIEKDIVTLIKHLGAQ